MGLASSVFECLKAVSPMCMALGGAGSQRAVECAGTRRLTTSSSLRPYRSIQIRVFSSLRRELEVYRLANKFMGKQVRFFMTYEDEKEFLEAVRLSSPVQLVRNTFADESKNEIQSLQPVGTTHDDSNLSLFNVAAVSQLKQEFFPSSHSYCIDLTESEVVQFNRCMEVKNWLADGRLWFEEKSRRGMKSDVFVKWAKSLLKWVQSNYYKDDGGNFVAPHALKLSKAGKLQLGPPIEPSILLEERQRILGLR